MIEKIISYINNKKMINHKIKEISSLPLEISFMMNFECNYDCSYCFARKPKDKSEYRKYNAKEWTDKFIEFYRKYGKCRLVLTGGEPLLYKDSIDFVIEMTKYHFVHLGTNLFINSGFIEKIAAESNNNNLYLTASYHPEMANLGEFIDKMKILKEYKINSGSTMVLYPRFLNKIEYYAQEFQSKDISISFFPYIGEYEGRKFPEQYSEDESIICKKFAPGYYNKSTNYVLPKTKGMKCFAGVKTISIYPNGDLRRCISNNNIMSNIFEHNFSLFKNPQPCELDFCDCQLYWKYHLKI